LPPKKGSTQSFEVKIKISIAHKKEKTKVFRQKCEKQAFTITLKRQTQEEEEV